MRPSPGEEAVGDHPIDAADVAGQMFGRDAAARALGIELISAGPGRAVLRMAIRDDMINPLGVCHGGLIFTLADTAMALTSNSDNRYSISNHAEIDWIRPGRPGSVLTATAAQVHHHGRAKITDVSVTDEHGELIAVFRGRTRQVTGHHIER